MKLGIMFDPGAPPNQIAELSGIIEAQGFDQVWTAEGAYSWDIVGSLFLMARNTKKIELGFGVTNPYTRHPVKTALAVGSVNAFSNGRVIFSFGAGSREAIQSLGLDWSKPIAHCREMAEITRGVLSGDEFSYQGQIFKVDKIKPWFNPLGKVPIILACRRKKMLRMAAETMDGVMLDNAPVEYISYAKQQIEGGAESSGRTLEDFDLINLNIFAVSDDPHEAKQKVKRLMPYNFITISKREVERMEIDAERVKQIQKAVSRQTPEDMARAASLITDKMVEKMTVTGTPEDCVRTLKAHEREGVTTMVLGLVSLPGTNPEETLRMAGEHIIPNFK